MMWGSQGSGDGEFGTGRYLKGPSGICVDPAGNVYVADPANHRIQKFDSSGKFLMQWGPPGPIASFSWFIAPALMLLLCVGIFAAMRRRRRTPQASLQAPDSVRGT